MWQVPSPTTFPLFMRVCTHIWKAIFAKIWEMYDFSYFKYIMGLLSVNWCLWMCIHIINDKNMIVVSILPVIIMDYVMKLICLLRVSAFRRAKTYYFVQTLFCCIKDISVGSLIEKNVFLCPIKKMERMKQKVGIRLSVVFGLISLISERGPMTHNDIRRSPNSTRVFDQCHPCITLLKY